MKAIDLFAGAGGSSLGIRAAGWQLLWAANHNIRAVDVHRANHPEAQHVCQDLHQADWTQVPAHDALWASPSCRGHSQAASRGGSGRRGSAPYHDADRSTAWAIISCVEAHRPPVVIVENVTHFHRWTLYGVWKEALQQLGYALSEQVLDAVQFGVPQDRPRLFIIGVLGRTPFRLPMPPRLPHQGLGEVVDFEAGEWMPLHKCAAGVQRRIARALKRGRGSAFLTQGVTGHAGRGLSQPFPAVTTKHQMGLVRTRNRQYEYRPLDLAEYQGAMAFPADYDLLGAGVCQGLRLLGNAVCPPVAEWICREVEKA